MIGLEAIGLEAGAEALALLAWAQGQAWGALLVFLRVGAMLALTPAFGEQTVPARVRLGLALAFTLVVLPAVAGDLPAAGEGAAAAGLLLGEVAAGLAFGVVLRAFVWALQTAGAIAAQATSLAQIFGAGPGGEPSPALTHLMVAAALALAAALGLHVRVAAYMIGSYALAPAGAALDPGMLLEAGLGEVGRSTALAFGLAAPFAAAALLYNLVLGVVNRAMPQLMVTFVGAPLLTAGGLGLALLALPALLGAWADAFGASLREPFAP